MSTRVALSLPVAVAALIACAGWTGAPALAGDSPAAQAFDARFRSFESTSAAAMPRPLAGRRIAMLVADEFNAVEGFYPLFRLREAGADVVVIGAEAGRDYSGRGRYVVRSQLAARDARGGDFDAIIVPGGAAPKPLREDPDMVRIVREAHDRQRLLAAVCHGPQLLARADLLRGKRFTAWPELQQELSAAGGTWVGDAVTVRDGHVVTSQDPWTIDAFTFGIIDALSDTRAGATPPAASTQATSDLAPLSTTFTGPRSLDGWTQLAVPGFAPAWKPVRFENNALVIEPRSSGWFEDMIGGHLHREVTGNFIITTRLRVTGTTAAVPQTAFSLAGLFIRAPRPGLTAENWRPGKENWMFLSVGSASPAGTSQFEIKSTTNSLSSLKFSPAPQGWMQLRIARHGELFTLLHKADGATEWTVLEQFIRPDLPETLQVGITAYADWDSVAPIYPDFRKINQEGAPKQNADLKAEFASVTFRRAQAPRVPIFALDVPKGAFGEDLIKQRTAEMMAD
jgi:PfpI family intracellular protease